MSRALVGFCSEHHRQVLEYELTHCTDATTGCTPIVLAIRANHVDVVRELLLAGAIVPPPGLTYDPAMLSILYPHSHAMQSPVAHFSHLPPNGVPFYPSQPQMYMRGPSPNSFNPSPSSGSPAQQNAQANLPPAEVAKTIPCRNFPNCKYGASCVFFHPINGAGFPGAGQGPRHFQHPGSGYHLGGPMQNGSFMPNGMAQEGAYPQPPQSFGQFPTGPYYVPNGYAPPFSPQQQQQPQIQQTIPESQDGSSGQQVAEEGSTEAQGQPNENSSDGQNASSTPAIPVGYTSQPPSAIAPVFVPSYPQPGLGMNPLASPPPPSQYGMSPLSPSQLAGSLPSIPPAEAFFATSPPPNGMYAQGPPPVIANGFVPNSRRQSFGQPFGLPGGPKGYHGKKPSFSGPRPAFGRNSIAGAGSSGPGGANLGAWKDGNPPPCAFFAQAKCRNGEMCKFPHLDESGADVRHPDVVRGVLAPLPSLGKQNRGMRMSMGAAGAGPIGNGFGGHFDPSFRQQQQYNQFLQQQSQLQKGQQQASQQQTQGEESPEQVATSSVAQGLSTVGETNAEEAASSASNNATPATVSGETLEKTNNLPSSIPAKPQSADTPQIVRSASQPGVQRVHGGFGSSASRSHSPAPSNVSFHGNGHPGRRPNGGRVPFPNGANGNANGNGQANGHAHVNGNASRSSSQAGESRASRQALQRIPRADEFPALGGKANGNASANASGDKGGLTAAQILSAPAPAKPVKADDKSDADNQSESNVSQYINEEQSFVLTTLQSVSMNSDAESDTVIVSRKQVNGHANGHATNGDATPTAVAGANAVSPPRKASSVSFAKVISAVSSTSAVDSAPIGVPA